jgi:hypothetical protein
VETAADKMCALAWRVQARRRGSDRDDPTIIRHLHDLAALKGAAEASPDFTQLVRATIAKDAARGGEATAVPDPTTLFAAMLETLNQDALWAIEYENFVDAVSFAAPGAEIGFAAALDATRELVALIEGYAVVCATGSIGQGSRLIQSSSANGRSSAAVATSPLRVRVSRYCSIV